MCVRVRLCKCVCASVCLSEVAEGMWYMRISAPNTEQITRRNIICNVICHDLSCDHVLIRILFKKIFYALKHYIIISMKKVLMPKGCICVSKNKINVLWTDKFKHAVRKTDLINCIDKPQFKKPPFCQGA